MEAVLIMATRRADGNPLKNGPATAIAGRIPVHAVRDVVFPFEPMNGRFALAGDG
jgi:hypothetical protein